MVCLLTEAFGDIKKKHKKKEEGANYISKNLLSEFKPLDHNFNESMNTNELEGAPYAPYKLSSDTRKFKDNESLQNYKDKLTHNIGIMGDSPYSLHPFANMGHERKEESQIPPQPPSLPKEPPREIKENITVNMKVKDTLLPSETENRAICKENEDTNQRIYISNKEYQDFVNFQKNKYKHNHTRKLDEIEGFQNINDNFNDVLLFFIMNVFFIMILDYVFKMGKRSY
jgi:hypothetical protein